MNTILNKEQSRKLILETLKPIYDLIKVTYGPYGNNVIISNQYGQSFTKDGLSVISTINDEDIIKNSIISDFVQLIKFINDINLDGSTTSTIITYSLLKEFSNDINLPPYLLSEMLLSEIDNIKSYLEGISYESTESDMNDALNIALNGNEELRKLIPNKVDKYTYEIVKGSTNSLESYKGFKTNLTYNFSQNFNSKSVVSTFYIREFSSYPQLYKELKELLSKENVLIFKRIKGSKIDLDAFVDTIKRDFNVEVFPVCSLLPPKELPEYKGNLITHYSKELVTITDTALYLGDNIHHIISLNTINDSEFKQKKDALDDAFSALKMNRYLIGGGFSFFKLYQHYAELAKNEDNIIYKYLAKAFLSPVEALSEKANIPIDSIIHLFKSNKIYNFATKKEESISETKVKESLESLKVMFEYSFKYLSNFITIGSIIQQ